MALSLINKNKLAMKRSLERQKQKKENFTVKSPKKQVVKLKTKIKSKKISSPQPAVSTAKPFDPIKFAKLLASKCKPGVIDALRKSSQYDDQRKQALSSPAKFITYVQTKDEHDEIQPVKLFPEKPYIPYLLDLWTKKKQSIFFVAKSRQIMLTWLCCVYALWLAKSVPHRLIFLQSKKEEDAANLVFSGGRTGKNWDTARISFIEKHLPEWLQDKGIESAYGKLLFPNGSKIWGVPEGADMIRSYTPSLVISDEAAFQPEFGSAYTAMLPIAKQGGQLLAISSANPGPFGEIVAAC